MTLLYLFGSVVDKHRPSIVPVGQFSELCFSKVGASATGYTFIHCMGTFLYFIKERVFALKGFSSEVSGGGVVRGGMSEWSFA